MDSTTPNSHKMWVRVIVLVLILLAAGTYYYANKTDTGAGAQTASVSPITDNSAAVLLAKPRAGETEITGNFACTPMKDGQPVAEGKCIMGLKGDDGKFYALDTSNIQVALGTDVTKKVRVVGAFTPVDAKSSEVGQYQYDGVLVVRAVDTI